MPYGIYTSVQRADFMTKDAMIDLAENCGNEGFSSDAHWWAGRARETQKPRFVDSGSSGDSWQFSTSLLSTAERKAFKRLAITDTIKHVCRGRPGKFSFFYCEM